MLLLFDAQGKMQYLKELDPQIHTSGPCLSNASYASVTKDGTMSSRVQISGGRTDDMARVFVHVRYEALQDFDFTRLVFFQLGSETYNYHANFTEFVMSDVETGDDDYSSETHITRTCTGKADRKPSHMYQGGPHRDAMKGEAPWWFAFAANNDPGTLADSDTMVVGDRGLVIREFDAKLGGTVQTSPTFSVLCDKIEIGTPAGLSKLLKGDYVDMKLEILVLPRAGEEFTYAKKNVASRTLDRLSSLSNTWEMVKAQADGHLIVTDIAGGSIESHYPSRVAAHNGEEVKFKVKGSALGFVPIVIANLTSYVIPTGRGLFLINSTATSPTPLDQGSTGAHDLTGAVLNNDYRNDFWQTNYDRASGTYEIVYNVEIFEDLDVWFSVKRTPLDMWFSVD